MSSHPLCGRHHTNYVRHHRWHIYAIICTIQYIISTLYDKNLYYLWHHMHCIHDITHTIYDMSSTVCDITYTICMTSNNDCFYDITHSTFMTYLLYMASHTVLWKHNHCVLHSHYVWYHTQCINFIKPRVCMTSPPLYVFNHMKYIWHHIHSLWHHTSLFMTSSLLYVTSHPPYLTSCPLYLCHHTHSIDDITANICMISHPI